MQNNNMAAILVLRRNKHMHDEMLQLTTSMTYMKKAWNMQKFHV